MKKSFGLLHFVVMLVGLLSLTGCQKIIDRYFPGHGNHQNDCKITRIKRPALDFSGNAVEHTGNFSYNATGDPDTVVFSFGDEVVETYYFTYNAQRKLIQSGSYSRVGTFFFALTHKYGYSEAGRIMRDSVEFNSLGPMGEIDQSATEYLLEYDSKGRIIKESGIMYESDYVPVHREVGSRIYEYNADGNRILTDSGLYDNKVNYLRTNKVWMFTARNYSLNNPMGAIGYNEFGLPLGFQGSASASPLFGVPSAIVYECE